jgi:hypothetical protein
MWGLFRYDLIDLMDLKIIFMTDKNMICLKKFKITSFNF